MSGKNSHECFSLFAFSMPMIAFVVALGIGLAWGPTEKGEDGKERPKEAQQNTAIKK